MKNTDRLHYLMQRYFSESLTEDEKQELAVAINSSRDKENLKKEILREWNEDTPYTTLPEADSDAMQTTIIRQDRALRSAPNRRLSAYVLRVAAVAASLLILLSVGFGVNYLLSAKQSANLVAKADLLSPASPASYIRNIILPDGSTVILKAGSTLKCPENFSAATREVTLQGEAYFDIVHNPSKPFIIHTGNVKTTVLGTAFNIKAWPNQKRVTVSVTRGKVRVEDNKQVLAVLTVNQSVDYNIQNKDATKQIVNAEEVVTDWAKQDMVFNHVTLAEIAQALSRRYGVDIEIENKELASFVVVSSFVGTESLNNVLDVLCGIYPNSYYSIKGREIVIALNRID